MVRATDQVSRQPVRWESITSSSSSSTRNGRPKRAIIARAIASLIQADIRRPLLRSQSRLPPKSPTIFRELGKSCSGRAQRQWRSLSAGLGSIWTSTGSTMLSEDGRRGWCSDWRRRHSTPGWRDILQTLTHVDHLDGTRCGIRVAPFPVVRELRCELFDMASKVKSTAFASNHHASRTILR